MELRTEILKWILETKSRMFNLSYYQINLLVRVYICCFSTDCICPVNLADVEDRCGIALTVRLRRDSSCTFSG